MTAKHQDTETQGAGVWQNPFTENPETDTQKDGKTDTPKGVTVWETFEDFIKDAPQRYTPQLIAQIQQFFDATKNLQTKLQAAADAAFNEETGEDSAPRSCAVTPPVLMDKKTQIMTDYLTGLFNPLVSGRYVKAGEIAKKEGLTRGLRTFASLNRQEIEVLNYIIGRARENLKIQADRLRQGLPPLSQGGRVTYAEVIRAYNYGKNADVNAKIAAAFDLLAREKFLFFDEVRGEIRPISILDGVFNLKTKAKTYVISQQFLNTLPAIDACLLYYNIKQLTNGKMNVGDVSQYRGDKGILLVCIQLLFEMPYYDKKPFVYSSIAERARVKGVELKKNKDWKRAIKQAFNYLGYGVIDGDSDTARAMSENPNFTPNGDIFIIRPIEEVTAAEN